MGVKKVLVPMLGFALTDDGAFAQIEGILYRQFQLQHQLTSENTRRRAVEHRWEFVSRMKQLPPTSALNDGDGR